MIKRSGLHADILHEVVEKDGILYFAGITGEDKSQDMAGQTRSVFAQIDELLAAHGSDKDHLLTALIFVTDMKQKPAMNTVWKEWLKPGQLPTRATIGSSDLDGYLIEVVVTAAKAG
ncbi:MAG: RidA family protein [Thalassobaculum sp.]|uniref:RidA family protein n=1 Tax=Thalassobaculum sp. TaxID=2022740 RepID=UPI0032EFB599